MLYLKVINVLLYFFKGKMLCTIYIFLIHALSSKMLFNFDTIISDTIISDTFII